MAHFRTWFLLILVTLGTIACGQESNQNSSPEIASATNSIAFKERRIAVVYSDTSAQHYFDEFSFGQLFTAMQHQAMQSGVPYDLLNEADLTNATELQKYDALIIPLMSHVDSSIRESIINALLAAQNSGTAIITASDFLTHDPNNNAHPNAYSGMIDILGLTPKSYQVGVPAKLKIANNQHAITSSYERNETLGDYEQSWFAEYSPVDTSQAITLVEASVENDTHTVVQAIERAGRVVHFSNDAFIADKNLVWSAIRWAIYGDVAPVSLLPSRSSSVFVARNDMDQAMIPAELNTNEFPLLDIIQDWKRDYNFVGSYYIDIGNDPLQGEYTDWGVSAPLYAEYLALGNEFGTHSWTHPHYTSLLSDAELEFEFNQSKQEISQQLGINVIGGAVPGNSEDLNVVENLNQWFDYFSGRSITGSLGYRSGFGYLKPEHNMRYFNLNMTPDFGLIDFRNYTPGKARKIWLEEYEALQVNAELPVMHWLWHDYGPTAQAQTGRYSKLMFEDTVKHAYSSGSEFVTLEDYHERLSALETTTLSTGFNGEISARVAGTGLGQFALKINPEKSIASVSNWYAYSDKAVFITDEGGDFTIVTGNNAADDTRIVDLPMRARLISVNGNGNELDFRFSGEGEVKIKLSNGMVNNTRVTGADSFKATGKELTLNFNEITEHTVTISAITAVNSKPVASTGAFVTTYATPVQINLTGTDPNQDALSYVVTNPPSSGELIGTVPNLTYIPADGFSGVDSFSFIANDGSIDSASATVAITVSAPMAANSTPVANKAILNTVVNQSINLQLSGADNESASLTYTIVTPPIRGSLSGTAPNLTYQPFSAFSGVDEFSFSVSDGVNTSDAARVVIHISQQPLPSNGTVSNAVSGDVEVDAQLIDWAGVGSFGIDSQEPGNTNDNDWKQAWLSHDNANLFIAYEQHGAAAISWRNQILLDTDTNRNTGFLGLGNEYPLGADFIVEGGALLEYTGTGLDWSWRSAGQIDIAVNGSVVELALPRTALAGTIGSVNNINLFFQSIRLDNTPDYYPDDAASADAVAYTRQFSYSFTANQNPANAAPVANSIEHNTANNAELPIKLSGFDLDADSLSYTLSTQPAHGSLLGVAPNVYYMPSAGYTGTDSFTFTVNDGSLASNTATVHINVVAPPAINGIPVALNQSLVVAPNATIGVTLSGSDFEGSALDFSIVTNPAHGLLSGNAPALSYKPNPEYTGEDSFTYRVSDGYSASEIATVTLVVGNGNTPPVAINRSVVVQHETAIGIKLSGTDADGDALIYNVTTQPTAGTLSGNAPNLTYTPFNTVTGVDSFKFTINDGSVDSAPATISIEIMAEQSVNQAPTAIGQSISSTASAPVSVELTGVDPDNNELSFVVTQAPQGGTLSGAIPNLIYTPNAGFSGIDRLRFKANDGALDSAEAVVTFNVSAGRTGSITNSINNLTIDGDVSDWVGLAPFPDDADDVSHADNPLNWRSLVVAHDTNNLYFLYRNDGPFTLSWGHGMYIDTDGTTNTGFRDFFDEAPIGADYLIEGNNVHRYTGTGNDWSWEYLGTATSALQIDMLEFSVPRSMLGNPGEMRMYLRASNEPFGGNIIDFYPDAALDNSREVSERLMKYVVEN